MELHAKLGHYQDLRGTGMAQYPSRVASLHWRGMPVTPELIRREPRECCTHDCPCSLRSTTPKMPGKNPSHNGHSWPELRHPNQVGISKDTYFLADSPKRFRAANAQHLESIRVKGISLKRARNERFDKSLACARWQGVIEIATRRWFRWP
jgi:hypothetical protein